MKKITFQIIRKSQILAVTVTLMLVVAGYLNYTYDPSRNFDVELTGKIEDSLGDAVLVDSKNVETNIDDIVESVNNPVSKDENEDYFIQTKIDRTNSYAEQIEIYEDMLNNNNLSNEQKDMAQKQISKINNIRNSIIISENLIKLKGFENSVVLVSDTSINIVVKASKLSEKQVAQIQNIIVNEFNCDINMIHISNKA